MMTEQSIEDLLSDTTNPLTVEQALTEDKPVQLPKDAEGPIVGLPYEEAVARLEKIVARLEGGEISLDESMQLFQKGMQLSGYCSDQLQSMEQKIQKLLIQPDGTVRAESFDEENSL